LPNKEKFSWFIPLQPYPARQEIGANTFVAPATSLEELVLSVRTYDLLRKSGIKTIEDLCSWSEARLTSAGRWTRRTRVEIKEELAKIGKSLAAD